MSVQAMAWAMDHPFLEDHSARHVLLILANYADHQGRSAHPSVSTIARQTGLSERAVQMKMGDLLDAGVIRPGNSLVVAANISRSDRRPNVYDLAMDAEIRVQTVRPVQGERGAKRAPRKRATGCKPCTNGVQSVQERGAGFAPEPSKNHPTEPSIPPIVPQAAKVLMTVGDKPLAPALLSALSAPAFPKLVKPKQGSSDFTDFWASYPRKVCKPNAERAFGKAVLSAGGVEPIAQALERAKAHDHRFREIEFTPHPASWLNAAPWHDELPTAAQTNRNNRDGARVINREDRLARERIEQLQTEGGYFDD